MAPLDGVQTTALEPTKDPFAALRAACETQAESLVAPTKEKLIRVRALLDAFEANLRARAEARVMSKIHEALGQPAPTLPADALDEIEDQLFGELDALTPDWAKPPSPVPVPAPSMPVAPRAEVVPVPRAHTMPEPTEGDLAKAKAIIREVETTDYAAEHPLRSAPLMQAHVAEIRSMLLRIPERHPIGWQLTQLIGRLSRAKLDANIEPFIRGLSRNHRPLNWERVAFESRKQVAKFDVDADKPADSIGAPAKKPKKEQKEDDRPTLFNWPSLPKLRDRLKQGPLVLAGGVAVPNKLSSMQTRFGIAAEWHEIEESSPRAVASLVDKIRKGNVGAVIVLKGLLGHDAWKEILEASKAVGVPCAIGDKAGIGDLQTSLEHLDKVS